MSALTSLVRHAHGRRKKREPGRRHDDKDRPAIIAWGSRQGAVMLQATRDCTVQAAQRAATIAVHVGSRRYTDSASRYRVVQGYRHESDKSGGHCAKPATRSWLPAQ